MKQFLLCVTALCWQACAAGAVTISNDDNRPHLVTVTTPAGQSNLIHVEANSSANFACPDGCQVRVNGQIFLMNSDGGSVTISNGRFAP